MFEKAYCKVLVGYM